METDKKVLELDIDEVLPNRFQPRIKFDEKAIFELAESIKEHGVIQPIIVRQLADRYEIIAGERRYKASVLAGKKTIPAIINNLNDQDSAEVALIENVQRRDLTPIEEAVSYKKILDMGYLTQEGLAAKLDKSQSTIANKLRLLNLHDSVQDALLEGKISERHARSLLKIEQSKKQEEVLNRIISDRLTVRATDNLIDEVLSGNTEAVQEEINQETEGEMKMNENEKNIFNIPSTPIMNDEDDQNENRFAPGFLNIDQIEQNAQDIFEEKAAPNMDFLLKPEPLPILDEKVEEQPNIFGNAMFTPQSTEVKNEEQSFDNDFRPGKFFGVEQPENTMPLHFPVEDSRLQETNEFVDVKEKPDTNFVSLTKENTSFDNFDFFNNQDIDLNINQNTGYDDQSIQSFNQIDNIETAFSNNQNTFESSEFVMPNYDFEQKQPEEISAFTNEPAFESMDFTMDALPQQPTVAPVNNDLENLNFDSIFDVPETNEFTPEVNIPSINESIPEVEVKEEVQITPIPLISDFEEAPEISGNFGYAAPAEMTKSNSDLRIAINTVRDLVSMLENQGYMIDTDELDMPNNYQIVINISK